jgi:hypothetical protein
MTPRCPHLLRTTRADYRRTTAITMNFLNIINERKKIPCLHKLTDTEIAIALFRSVCGGPRAARALLDESAHLCRCTPGFVRSVTSPVSGAAANFPQAALRVAGLSWQSGAQKLVNSSFEIAQKALSETLCAGETEQSQSRASTCSRN